MTNIYDSLKNKSFEDPNINCAIAARADTSDDKIDLSLGTLCDKDGKFYMFELVIVYTMCYILCIINL